MRPESILALLSLPIAVGAQVPAYEMLPSDADVVQLPGISIIASRVANMDPAASFASPVTALRYQPWVDVQSRGFAEAQADIVIRGGTFENSGFRLGAVNLVDPQTGHYYSELPVDPAMLGAGSVETGAANALNGFNSTVGTVSYEWMPITTGGIAETGLGTDNLYFGRTLVGWTSGDAAVAGRRLGVQVGAAYSEGDGTVQWGDHQFRRVGARLQLADESAQTDLYAGWQSKFYGWPGMYTGAAALQETDDYEVTLVTLNHVQQYGDDSYWTAGAYWRGFVDDYELDRDRPGYYRPYEHTTRVAGLAVQGVHTLGAGYHVDWRAEALGDDIESTELTYAGFTSRSYYKVTLLPGYTVQLDPASTLDLAAGASWDDSNRDDGSASPTLLASYTHNTAAGHWQLYAQYARSTQLAGYTALGSNPGPGAFSGNAALPREAANNHEIGIHIEQGQIQGGADIFYRQHHNLADWTFDLDAPGTYRKANAVDLDVWGVETYIAYVGETLRLSVSYAWLSIDSQYEDPAVDGSYYALNYPEHRLTAAIQWQPVETIDLRLDAEARRQEANARRTSADSAFLSSASIAWTTPVDGLSVSLLADNLTDCDYQEFPGVPADGRQLATRLTYTW